MNGQLAVLQHIAVQVTQDRKQNLVFQHGGRFGRGGAPINVEKVRIRGAWAVFEDIHPPGVLMAGSHVVGYDVQEKAHAVVLELFAQIVEFFICAEL
jgi:hypothetical protein